MTSIGLNPQTNYIRNNQKPNHSCNWGLFWRDLVIWILSLSFTIGLFVLCYAIKNFINQDESIQWIVIFGKQPDYYLLYTTLSITAMLTLISHQKSNFVFVIFATIISTASLFLYGLVYFEVTSKFSFAMMYVNIAFLVLSIVMEIFICYRINKR